MDEKRAYEAFRVRKFSSPHPALIDDNIDSDSSLQGAGAAGEAASEGQLWSRGLRARVILHFDCDAFYAQVGCDLLKPRRIHAWNPRVAMPWRPGPSGPYSLTLP